MSTGNITKRSVDAMQSSQGDVYLWDTKLSGFGIRLTSKGTRTYLVQYRVGGRGGPTRRVTIGRHGAIGADGQPITPDKARAAAKALLGIVASGGDPAEEKTKARKDPTISVLVDLYFREGCTKKKPSTMAMEGGLARRHILPLLGKRKVRSLTRRDVERFMADVANGKTAMDEKTDKARGRAIVRGGKGTANRTRDLLASILSFSVHEGLRDDNPAGGVKKYPMPPRERFLSPRELAILGEAVAAAEQTGQNPIAIAAIRFLMLTGCRKSEALTLRWEWVDFENGFLRLPDSKTGAKVVRLGAPALALLRDLPRQAGSPYVFPSTTGEGFLVGLPKIWNKIRAVADLEDVRLHDLRHTFGAVSASSGTSLYIVGKLLGHAQSGTTERYAHLADDPLREAADRTSEHIASHLKRKPSGEIVEIEDRRA